MNSKTIVLVVSSEGDYGDLRFKEYNEVNGLSLSYWAKKLRNEGRKFEVVEDEGNGYYFNVEYYEFGCIDPDFVKLIRNDIQDYDSSKNVNFYVEGIDFHL